MAPAPLMGMDPNNAQRQADTNGTPHTENKNASLNSAEKGLRCTSNCEDTTFETEDLLAEQAKAPEDIEDAKVDIVDCSNKSGIKLGDDKNSDSTEYSSSFIDTLSGNHIFSGMSDAEVESRFCDDNGLGPAFDGFTGGVFRTRKKLTSHWRKFIRPLMWRCKWMELRINELDSRAVKYGRELAACDQKKRSRIEQCNLEGFGSKSLPISSQYYRNKAVKRRKRKRVEDTTDITSYMSESTLYSYFEKKKSDPDAISVTDDLDSPGLIDKNANDNDEFGDNADWPLLQFRDGDDSLEQILFKIEAVHSRVHKLRAQMDTVMFTNASKFPSFENLSLLAPFDALNSAAHSPSFSAGNGDAIYCSTPTQHLSEYDIGDLVIPEIVVSSYNNGIPVPDIIESTIGLLSAADVSLLPPGTEDSCQDESEGERYTCTKTSNEPVEECGEQLEKGEEESIDPIPVLTTEVGPVTKTNGDRDQSALKAYLAAEVHFPKRKRKQREGKPSPAGWIRGCSSKHDS